MVRALPRGTPVSAEVWEKRHRWIVGLLWAQCVPLVIGSLIVGAGLAHSVAELVPVPALAFLASRSWVARSGTRTGIVVADDGRVTRWLHGTSVDVVAADSTLV